jgi:hypothetical protein
MFSLNAQTVKKYIDHILKLVNDICVGKYKIAETKSSEILPSNFYQRDEDQVNDQTSYTQSTHQSSSQKVINKNFKWFIRHSNKGLENILDFHGLICQDCSYFDDEFNGPVDKIFKSFFNITVIINTIFLKLENNAENLSLVEEMFIKICDKRSYFLDNSFDNSLINYWRNIFVQSFSLIFKDKNIFTKGINVFYDIKDEKEGKRTNEEDEEANDYLNKYVKDEMNVLRSKNLFNILFSERFDITDNIIYEILIEMENILSGINPVQFHFCDQTDTFYFCLISLFKIYQIVYLRDPDNSLLQKLVRLGNKNLKKIEELPLPDILEKVMINYKIS